MQRFVTKLLLRSQLSGEEQEAILRLNCRATQVRARTDIVSPGETVDHACLVAQGLVARFDQMLDGDRQITSFYIPGDMADLHSVVSPAAAWGITALSPATVVRVPHKELLEVARAYSAIMLAFWRDTVADGSVLAKWVGNLGRQDARARLAHVLCEIGIRMELAGLGTRTAFELDATQDQLADALGLTAVHVNRTLQRLRAERAVMTRGHVVEVLDWPRLADIAEFDPDFLLLGKTDCALLPGTRATSQR